MQDSTNSNALPDEQEDTHQEGYMYDEVLTFDLGTASPAIEEAPSKLTCLAILYVKEFSATDYSQAQHQFLSDAADAQAHLCTSTNLWPMSGKHT